METKNSTEEQNVKYNIKSLIELNPYYHSEHSVTQADVNMANTYVELIEKTRSNITPKPGDILKYTDSHGDYYSHAHIESNSDGMCDICQHPYVPFIYPDKKEICCNTSGGSWNNLESDSLKYIGKEQKCFCDWGHLGACGNGSVHFYAEVSVWEYIHPKPLYKDYTTEKWRKLYITRIPEDKRKEHQGYLYTSMRGPSFYTESEFQKFLMDYKGEVFSGHYDNQLIVWCYQEQQEVVSQNEYNALDLPVTSTYCNGKRPAKIKHDDENKTSILHFIM